MATKIMPGAKATPKSEYDRLIEQEVQKALGSTQQEGAATHLAAQRLRALEGDLMPSQRAFILDPSPKKGAICTRRAGKTFAIRHLAADAVLKTPWSNPVKSQPVVQYITQTRANAVDLFWTPFKRLCANIGLDAHWDDHQLRAQFPNGVLVRAGGCDDISEVEKYRGVSYSLVMVDEPQSIGPKILDELLNSAVIPATMDYLAPVSMTGTPGNSKTGLFYDIYCERALGWTKHSWSYMQNVHMPLAVRTPEWVEANIGPVTSPRVQREYFANWVTDDSELVYQFNAARNMYDGNLPKGHAWRYVMGLDLGFRDPCAFVVIAFAKTHPDAFVVYTHSETHMLPSAILERVKTIKDAFPGLMRIMVDTGGSMARNNMEEWIRRTGLPMVAAEKKKKYDYQEHMNSDFHLGRIKVAPAHTKLIHEWSTLVWQDADEQKTSVRHDGKPKEHPGFENHLADAALYAWRESLHYRSKSPVPEPLPGTSEFWVQQQRNAKLKAAQAGRSSKFKYQKLFK
jgi:hypothetical protein